MPPPKRRGGSGTTTGGGGPRDVKALFNQARTESLGKLGTYINKEEKEELAQSGEPFTIKNIEKSGGRFGNKWAFTVLFADGQELKFSLPDNEFRGELFPKLMMGLPLPDFRLMRNPNVSGEPYDVVPVGFDYADTGEGEAEHE